jgi:hypothetical protein
MEHNNEIHDVNEKLNEFFGTYHYYQHLSGKVYTDGVAELRNRYNCFWLLDIILCQAVQISQPFQHWVFKRDLSENGTTEKPNRFTLSCDDGNGNIVFSKQYGYRDFEGDLLQLYYCDNVLLLPSEY